MDEDTPNAKQAERLSTLLAATDETLKRISDLENQGLKNVEETIQAFRAWADLNNFEGVDVEAYLELGEARINAASNPALALAMAKIDVLNCAKQREERRAYIHHLRITEALDTRKTEAIEEQVKLIRLKEERKEFRRAGPVKPPKVPKKGKEGNGA